MFDNKKVYAVIVAAGNSSRIGFDKLTYIYDNSPVIFHTASKFSSHPLVDGVVIVAGKNMENIKDAVKGIENIIAIVEGGETRFDSVRSGINSLPADANLVAIQDGARPFVSERIITDTIKKASQTGAAAPAVAVKDTIKISSDGTYIEKTLTRSELFAVQTPQVVKLELYKKAAEKVTDKNITDDCAVMELAGYKVALVEGEYTNHKITTKEDLPKRNEGVNNMRIGHGYDVHRLTADRDLILGGIKIPYEKGLLGHSDADVLVHAIIDALLGAAAMGDIGALFPDNDEAYKGADSIELLKEVVKKLKNKGYVIVNIDSTILCQAPKLAGYIMDMRKEISSAINAKTEDVSVKATTEEKLGFTGNGEGISTHAVCILRKNDFI